MDEYLVSDEHGRPLTLDDVPSVRLLRGEPVAPLLMHTIRSRTGASRWQLLKSAPLTDADGRVVAAVTVIEDLTAVKSAEVRMRILSEAGRIFASSLDLGQTLENVAQVAVPELADWCVVDLIGADLQREETATAHRDVARRHVVQQMRELEPDQIDPDSTIGRVFLTGEPVLFFAVPDEHLFRVDAGAEHLEILRALGTRSALAVPMRVGAKTVGVMTCCTSESQRRLTEADLDLAAELANRAAMAVDNSRLHTTLAGVAETLQQSLLPSEPPPVPGWQVAALYRPAGTAPRIEVGGDFYEVVAQPEGCLAIIGDVTGHGVAAATVAALLRHGARFAARFEPQPAAILRRLDEALRQRPDLPLSTALCVRFGPGSLTLSSAGHPAALIVDARGNVREVPATGPLLGAFADAEWDDEEVAIAPGDLVLLYTDGVTETAGSRDRFGTDRLRRLLCDHAKATPRELLDALERSLIAFGEGAPRDDVAAMALTRAPAH